ncbi:hypothetical protein O181_009648 [Austropuccinia psidii MF-1]|uniref:Reverse transcriptase n=1 Tax=Austropuccinia psidii MF-1 TaxID=1389203 RepID=A0A9Q3BRR3_9BASI|nr:hypothetical protein [Austropuccinia psidii MF-1]
MLANRKATGPDRIPNKELNMEKDILTPHLKKAFENYLLRGELPEDWKISLTAIPKKAAKEDYSNPNSYFQIALLNTTWKLFE